MEKLIELLNEYKETKKILNYDMDGQLEIDNAIYVNYPNIERLCGKQFGFIKRLVMNDKIDFSLIPNKIKEIGIPMKINGKIKYGFDSSDYYWLLMLLSIQDNPIEFLISVLE